MREYLITVLTVSAVGGISVSLAHGSYKKITGTVAGIVLTLVILNPVLSAFDGILDSAKELPSFSEEEGESGYSEVLEEAFRSGVVKAVAKEFGVKEEDVYLNIEGFEAERMRAAEIRLVLVGRAATADIPRIRQYLAENFLADGGKCEVGIEIG